MTPRCLQRTSFQALLVTVEIVVAVEERIFTASTAGLRAYASAFGRYGTRMSPSMRRSAFRKVPVYCGEALVASYGQTIEITTGCCQMRLLLLRRLGRGAVGQAQRQHEYPHRLSKSVPWVDHERFLQPRVGQASTFWSQHLDIALDLHLSLPSRCDKLFDKLVRIPKCDVGGPGLSNSTLAPVHVFFIDISW